LSFNREARLVKSNQAPLGLRYISLRHCVELFCPLGFHKTWSLLEGRFGLKENQENDAPVLVAAVELLEQWRQAHIELQAAHRKHAQELARLGLPKAPSKNSSKPTPLRGAA
jgi:hypothetical protein